MGIAKSNVIFCDDIRVEATGKLFLIGVYTGEIVVHQGPAVIGLGTWIDVWGLSKGIHSYNIRVVFDDLNELSHVADVSGNIEIIDADLPAVMFPTGLSVNVDRTGKLVVLASFDGGAEIELGLIKVTAKFLQAGA